MNIYSLDTDAFSWYKTHHKFKYVVDIENEADYHLAAEYANKFGLKCYALGNGSNTFFKKKIISSLLLKNCLPEVIRSIDENEIEVSSSTKLIKLLRFLYKEERDGPYYLASVPGTIGGAISMNAGTGEAEGHYIGQFIKSVSYLHNGKKFEKNAKDLELGFRCSMFSKRRDYFIISAKFIFPKKKFGENPIILRLNWAKEHQELKVPSCGSVWKLASLRILSIAHKIFRNSQAYISDKSYFWISNKSHDSKYIRRILKFVRVMHFFTARKCEYEIRIVD